MASPTQRPGGSASSRKECIRPHVRLNMVRFLVILMHTPIFTELSYASRATLKTIGVSAIMAKTVQLFTFVIDTGFIAAILTLTFLRIHHPFLLSDNRHYTFYVWRRVFMLHPIMPYILVPGYLACAWAWFLRAGMCFSACYLWQKPY